MDDGTPVVDALSNISNKGFSICCYLVLKSLMNGFSSLVVSSSPLLLTLSYSAPIKRRANALVVFYKQTILICLFIVDRFRSALEYASKLSPTAMSCRIRLAIAGEADIEGLRLALVIISCRRLLNISATICLVCGFVDNKSVSVIIASIVYVASGSANNKSNSFTSDSNPSLLSLSPNCSNAN